MEADVKILPPLGDWSERARCRNVNPNVFQPTTQDEAGSYAAKQICAQCPVREPCREYALVNYPKGIWGGCTEADLRRIRSSRRAQARKEVGLPAQQSTTCPGCGSHTCITVGTNRLQCMSCSITWVS